MNSLTFPLRQLDNGDRYVFLDEIDEGYRQMIEDRAVNTLTIFEIEGRYACPFETVMECSVNISD